MCQLAKLFKRPCADNPRSQIVHRIFTQYTFTVVKNGVLWETSGVFASPEDAKSRADRLGRDMGQIVTHWRSHEVK